MSDVSACDIKWNRPFGLKDVQADYATLGKSAWLRQLSEDPSLFKAHPYLTPPTDRVYLYALLPRGLDSKNLVFSFLPSNEEARWIHLRRSAGSSASSEDSNVWISRIMIHNESGSLPLGYTSETRMGDRMVEHYRDTFSKWSLEDQEDACTRLCRRLIWKEGSGWSMEYRTTCIGANSVRGVLEFFGAISLLLPDGVARALGRPACFSRLDPNIEAADTYADMIKQLLGQGSIMEYGSISNHVPWTTESQLRVLGTMVRQTYDLHSSFDVPVLGSPDSPEVAAATARAVHSGTPMRSDYVSVSYGLVLPPPPLLWHPPPLTALLPTSASSVAVESVSGGRGGGGDGGGDRTVESKAPIAVAAAAAAPAPTVVSAPPHGSWAASRGVTAFVTGGSGGGGGGSSSAPAPFYWAPSMPIPGPSVGTRPLPSPEEVARAEALARAQHLLRLQQQYGPPGPFYSGTGYY